jgi:hypothetical protein
MPLLRASSMARTMLIGALLTSINAALWTMIAVGLGEWDQVAVGMEQIVGLGLAGALGGAVFWAICKVRSRSGHPIEYGPWVCGGVSVAFALPPLQALLTGGSALEEVANLLRTPSMLILLLVGGALSGYMMGRWVGALDSALGSNRHDGT